MNVIYIYATGCLLLCSHVLGASVSGLVDVDGDRPSYGFPPNSWLSVKLYDERSHYDGSMEPSVKLLREILVPVTGKNFPLSYSIRDVYVPHGEVLVSLVQKTKKRDPL